MEKPTSKLNRRRFIRNVGIGAVSLAFLPGFNSKPTNPGRTNLHFLAISDAAVVNGVHHRMIMGGDGHITPGTVVGGGSFQHQNNDGPTPQPILGEGAWQAKRLVSFDVLGTHGVGVAGVLNMDIVLLPDGGGRIPAHVEVVCNIPPAGLFTGKPEGYVLSIPGAPFGDFVPLGPPPLGITWFTTAHERGS